MQTTTLSPEFGRFHWAVTELAHPGLRDSAEPCAECLAQAGPAVTWARVTGSRGSTHHDGDHSATVLRMLAQVVTD